MKSKLISFLGVVFMIWSCSSTDDQQKLADKVIEQETEKVNVLAQIDHEELKMLMGSIPPPVQISSIISQKGYKYQSKILRDVSTLSNIVNSYDQAFSLGVYGADLGYTQVFGQVGDGLAYFEAIFKLSSELHIDHFFDRKLIRRLSSSQSIDSLLLISTDKMDMVNQYFIDQQNPQLSLLILTGSWLESSYLLAQSQLTKPSIELQDRIAEQEIALEILEELYKKYPQDQQLQKYRASLKKVTAQYAKIEVVRQEIKGTTEHIWKEDGTMTITPQTETKVIVEKEDLDKLIATIVSTRNELILKP
jgi:hypothetical protein